MRVVSIGLLALAAFGCGAEADPALGVFAPAPGAPPGYRQAAVSYDSGRGRTVMVGGYHPSPERLGIAIAYNETWEWDGQVWAKVSEQGPSPRFDLALGYDAARGRTVLFGGFGACGAPDGFHCCGDTWEWDGANWRVIKAEGPGPLRGATMVYNAQAQAMDLLGGTGCEEVPTANRGIWRYDGQNWSKVWP